MKYRYRCRKCGYTAVVEIPMGDDLPAMVSKSHPERNCPNKILTKMIEKPNLNNVNRFGTRSARDKRK